MSSQILLLFLINVLSAIGYSLIAPLYPFVAESKGVSDFTIGVIFSSFAISNVIAIPLTPKLANSIGRRRLFYIAMIIEVRII
jgi:MFS family permease